MNLLPTRHGHHCRNRTVQRRADPIRLKQPLKGRRKSTICCPPTGWHQPSGASATWAQPALGGSNGGSRSNFRPACAKTVRTERPDTETRPEPAIMATQSAVPPPDRGASGTERYPHPAARVELVETHASWLLLAGEFAYRSRNRSPCPFLITAPWRGARPAAVPSCCATSARRCISTWC